MRKGVEHGEIRESGERATYIEQSTIHQRNTPRWIFVEPARFERANGKKDLQGQAVKWREVDWGVRESQLTGCSAGETDEPPLERNSDDFSQEG